MRSFLLLLLTCSWLKSSLAYDWNCNLFCFNGGECYHGKGKFGNYAGIDDDTALPFEEIEHLNGMFCACPKGYTGLQCEIKFVVCGEDGVDEHTCFNGSQCKKERTEKGEAYYRCECDVAHSDMSASYAGKYCEHASTTFCNRNKEDSDFGGSTAFCTNGGKCKPKLVTETAHAGCDCTEDWEGPHCEFSKVSDGSGIALSAGAVIGIACAATVVVVVGLFVWKYFAPETGRASRNRRASNFLTSGGAMT